MSIKYRVVPFEPTAEMLRPFDRFMRPEAAKQLLMEVFAAAPVTPAGGEPEVFEVNDLDGDGGSQMVVSAEAHRAHFTRLQAEVAELKQQVEWRGEMAASNERQYTEQLGKVIALQSELTKAREFAAKVHDGMNGMLALEEDDDVLDYLGTEAANFLGVGHRPEDLKKFVAHQSAPAAKGDGNE